MIRFIAMPARYFAENSEAPEKDRLTLELPASAAVIDQALAHVEYQGVRAGEFFRAALGEPVQRGTIGHIIARPPADLPAVLRLADLLESLAAQESGELAQVWACECGTRYAVPKSLVRSVQIKCERCGRTLELNATKSLGEQALVDPFRESVNVLRRKLAAFFREAMARNWPIAVAPGRIGG